MWKPIDFWNIKPIYSINEHGLIINNERNKIRKSHQDKDGYLNVVLYDVNNNRINYKIHRLVARAFICTDNESLQINHIDGDKTNNHYTNLEWVTNSENQIHARRIGLKKSHIKISESDAKILCMLVLLRYSTSEIIQYFGVSSDRRECKRIVKRVHEIRKGTSFKDLVEECLLESPTTIGEADKYYTIFIT